MKKISDDKCVIYTTENVEYISTLMASDVEKYTFGAKPLYKLCFAENKSLEMMSLDAEIAAYLLDPSSAEYSIEKALPALRLAILQLCRRMGGYS